MPTTPSAPPPPGRQSPSCCPISAAVPPRPMPPPASPRPENLGVGASRSSPSPAAAAAAAAAAATASLRGPSHHPLHPVCVTTEPPLPSVLLEGSCPPPTEAKPPWMVARRARSPLPLLLVLARLPEPPPPGVEAEAGRVTEILRRGGGSVRRICGTSAVEAAHIEPSETCGALVGP